MVTCTGCGREWPSPIIAADCAEQDALEADDRSHGRLFGINRQDT